MSIGHGKPVRVYRRTGFALFLSGAFVFMGLVGFTAFFDPHPGGAGKIIGVLVAALCCGYAYVLWRSAAVVIYAGGALVGTAVRPRWVLWEQMIDVSLEPDISGYGRRGHVPVMHLKSGKSVKLGVFFVRDGRRSDEDIGQQVVQAMAQQIEAARLGRPTVKSE